MANEEGFERWIKRIRNFIPKGSTLWRGISIYASHFFRKVRKLAQSFSPYVPQTAFSSSMKDYPGSDLPLVIKIEAYKNQRHLHGASQYGDVFVESDGKVNTTNLEKFIEPIEGMTAPLFFIMSPKKLGLDPAKLNHAMKTEAAKVGDYDFYADNCIDHVVRPMKKAGAHLDFGYISTPKELAQWCDEQCKNGNGILVDLETYKKILAEQQAQKAGKTASASSGKHDKNNEILNKLLTDMNVGKKVKSGLSPVRPKTVAGFISKNSAQNKKTPSSIPGTVKQQGD